MLIDLVRNCKVFDKDLSEIEYKKIMSKIKSEQDVEDLFRRVTRLTKNKILDSLENLQNTIEKLEILVEKEEEFDGQIPKELYNNVLEKLKSKDSFESLINTIISLTKDCIVKKI